MDQLHLPPDLYRDIKDRSNAGVSAWLRTLAEVGRGRWDRRRLWVGLKKHLEPTKSAPKENPDLLSPGDMH
jgi:hypothetical protein